jgi:hypothetical protein
MRSHYDASFLLDEMLRRLERPGAPPRPGGKKRRPLARRIWQHLPPAARALLAPLKEPVKAQLGLEGRASRRFFAVPNNDACGAIRLNLAGRDPAGRVRPEEFGAVCDKLARDLRDFVNADTGEPLVRAVWRVRDVFDGPAMVHLPDMIVEWNRDAPVARVRSPKAGEITGQYAGCRTGDHSPAGFFCFTGPGVIPGEVTPGASIMDLTPTLAERLGVTLEGVDGRSLAGRVFANPTSA